MDYNYNPSDVDPLKQYLKDISQYKLLSNEETIELIKKAKAGNEEARDEIIKGNLRLVVSIAREHTASNGIPLLDLIQYGNLAIFKAIKNFDVNGKVRFSTYLSSYIDGSLRNAKSKECPMVNYAASSYYKVGKIKAYCDMFLIKNEREATDKEIKDALNVNQRIINLYRLVTESQFVLSLDSSCLNRHDKSDVTTLYDLLGKEDNNIDKVNDRLTIDKILSAINDLPIKDRNKNLFLYRYGMKDGNYHTLEDTGMAFGLNRERARQIETDVLKRVKIKFRANGNR